MSDALPDHVGIGMWLAYKLDLRMTIGGEARTVPPGIGKELDQVYGSDTAPSTGPRIEEMQSDRFETGRRIAYAIGQAAREIEALGLHVGLIAAERPPAPANAEPPKKLEPVTEPPRIGRLNGSTLIEGRFEVRPNEGSWILVDLEGRGQSELLGWYVSEEDAIEAGKQRLPARSSWNMPAQLYRPAEREDPDVAEFQRKLAIGDKAGALEMLNRWERETDEKIRRLQERRSTPPKPKTILDQENHS